MINNYYIINKKTLKVRIQFQKLNTKKHSDVPQNKKQSTVQRGQPSPTSNFNFASYVN